MELADWLLIGQLLVLIITGGIIVWYTIETREIRKGTISQAVLNPNAKIWDRQNEIDRILFTHPSIAQLFEELSEHNSNYFYSEADSITKDEKYFQLKQLVYLHLNFFEEIYSTTTSSTASFAVSEQFQREAWHEFIFKSMHHSLLREVFIHEMGITYTGEFLNWMMENEEKWNIPDSQN